MHEYEIRVLNGDGSTNIVLQEVHLNTDAAITKARRLAQKRLFEVWCDDRCVYAARKEAPPEGHPPRPAA
jgi:hypothetical protein